MERIFRLDRSIALALAILFAVSARAAPSDSSAPHKKGDAIAISPCSPLLAQMLPGDFSFCMGSADMEWGDHARGLTRMHDAAAWGDKAAQKVLGLAYFNGEGVAQDRALGLAWLALSTERKEPQNVGLFNSAWAQSSPEQKSKANTLYREMRSQYADDVAAVRADRLFRRKIRELTSNPAYGSGRCIAGVNGSTLNFSVNPDSPQQGCSLLSEQAVLNGLRKRYDVYFEDWSGRVSTGAIENAGADS